MKIGLLGGSFNPPHFGHLHISNLAIKKLELNQVWWIPCAYNQFKNQSIYQSYKIRLDLCKNLVKNSPKIYVKNFDEIHTAKLIINLKKKYKNFHFVWLMGADNFSNLHNWSYFDQLISNNSFAVFSRGTFLKTIHKTKGFQLINKKSINKIKIIRNKNLSISSTEIRNKNAKI
jgi:nicotinate-nucleotide adenylyltransferase